jgi:hypothetical protein
VICVALAGLWVAAAGPRLLVVEAPVPGQRVGIDGAEVFVRLDLDHAESATLRATLNGADVTPALAIGENGAHGRLHGLVDGPNVLELSVFGRGFWPLPLLLEERERVEFAHRRPLDLDQG